MYTKKYKMRSKMGEELDFFEEEDLDQVIDDLGLDD